MSRYSAFLLFLVVGPWIFCASDPVDYPEYNPTEAPNTSTTTAPNTSTTTAPNTSTTAAPTTSTAAPTTSTAAPTTSTAAPTTTTAAPTTTTAAPTTTTTTTAAPNTTTTAAPNTTTTTTAAPTTTAPNTTSTAPTPTTTPAPPLPKPTAHLYQVTKGNDSCLMVNFGLRIGFQGDKYEEMNFEYSNKTVVAGSCDEENSTLVIQADTLKLTLTFHNDTKKFSLRTLNATGKFNSGVTFSETNSTLTLWQASLGTSYMCNKEQIYNITKSLKIFTFDLQVQPFGVEKDSFSTAQECSMDDTSILIPIVVGAALAGLILIVVIAYVIGRRKTYVGYQTL